MKIALHERGFDPRKCTDPWVEQAVAGTCLDLRGVDGSNEKRVRFSLVTHEAELAECDPLEFVFAIVNPQPVCEAIDQLLLISSHSFEAG
jgi:hypothetical protein